MIFVIYVNRKKSVNCVQTTYLKQNVTFPPFLKE